MLFVSPKLFFGQLPFGDILDGPLNGRSAQIFDKTDFMNNVNVTFSILMGQPGLVLVRYGDAFCPVSVVTLHPLAFPGIDESVKRLVQHFLKLVARQTGQRMIRKYELPVLIDKDAVQHVVDQGPVLLL
ncbi:hypothetical protein D3C73_949640 [compost metagenome]